MVIAKKPFIRYSLQKGEDVITMKFNLEERQELDKWKYLLQQEKDSTALKQMARIGAKVLLDEKFALANEIIMNNFRKNKRLGIVTFDQIEPKVSLLQGSGITNGG